MRSVVISAGETSGDRYGAELTSKIKELLDDRIKFFGLGGERMAAAGVDLIADFTHHSVVASLGFLPHLAGIYSTYKKLIATIREQRPNLAVLIDTPTFNLFLAARLRRLGIPVVYFVSPQIWAWGKGRIKRIRRCVRKMIVIFPFEEEIYRRAGVDVGYFGHPLVHRVKPNLDRVGFCHKHGLDPSCPLICLLPGSRVEEVNHVLPTLIRAAHLIGDRFQYLISAAPNIDAGQIQNVIRDCKLTGRTPIRMTILKEDLYDALKHSAAAAVCSGTATLEAALMGTPFVMVYRIAFWRWSLRAFFVDVPYYCIVNLIAGRQVVRELMQHEFTPERTAAEISSLTSNESRRNEMVMDFHRVRALLDRGDALQSAAHSIMELLHSR